MTRKSLRSQLPYGDFGARYVRGMTLIELMVVLFIMALLVSGMMVGAGFFTGVEQRKAAALMVSAVRKGLAEANGSGLPTRLAIDFASNRIQLEQSSSKLALREDKTLTKEEEQSYADDLSKKAATEAQSLVSGMVEHKPTFFPSQALGQDGELPGRYLGGRVRVRAVQTEHDEEPLVEGVAYIYFWPGGVAERAIVQVGEGEKEGLTVVISSLTGRARIERGRVDLPKGALGEDYSEREER
jgi:general secretion pathway protein H